MSRPNQHTCPEIDGQTCHCGVDLAINGRPRSRITRFFRVPAGLVSAVAALAVSSGASLALASNEDIALNATYDATSNGEWARTNDVYHDEVTVKSKWFITSTCNSPIECTGTVSSDQGWTAQVRMRNGVWSVDRDLDGWERCADGRVFPGHQRYLFWPVDADGTLDTHSSNVLGGEDKTVGPSGACGVNRWLVVRMPFKLVKME